MFELIEAELREFEAALSVELRSDVEFINAIGADLVAAGGKRLRPALAYLTSAMIGGERDAATTVALSVELLHSASLLHDDLIDDSATRRGSSQSSSVGIPWAIAQYLHARVQTSPRIRNVAVPASQHSPMFGQPASSQTECRRCPRMSCLSRR